MQADAKPIESCLSEGSIGMSRAIMEAIASGSVVTKNDVQMFVKCTLLAATSDFQVRVLPPFYSPHPLGTTCVQQAHPWGTTYINIS